MINDFDVCQIRFSLGEICLLSSRTANLRNELTNKHHICGSASGQKNSTYAKRITLHQDDPCQEQKEDF